MNGPPGDPEKGLEGGRPKLTSRSFLGALAQPAKPEKFSTAPHDSPLVEPARQAAPAQKDDADRYLFEAFTPKLAFVESLR